MEVVRRIYDSIRRGATGEVLAAYREDVEFDLTRSPFRDFLPRHVVYGHDGLRAFFRERLESWDSMEDECVDLSGVGDRVIAEVVTRGRGRTSGIAAELTHYAVWTICDGKVARVVWCSTQEEASEAAADDR